MEDKKFDEGKRDLCKDCFWRTTSGCTHFIAKAYERERTSECSWFKCKE